ncbi:hypothetical protein Mal33_49780 [Rosistilla oblonga]|uniref:Uncharacterized protein n=1 Tax=Rosistilla oblonga TaxID=2527990 RepID=A0A518J0S9_9BACT|nr:hypothetical protein Mal33_49780 [Rosistilla oblonga]
MSIDKPLANQSRHSKTVRHRQRPGVFNLLLYQAAHHSMTNGTANLLCDNELATATLKMALRHGRKSAKKCFNADLADFSELRCEPG